MTGKAKTPFYVTTPIYYVNDKPHIGHAYTTLACDVLARFKRLDGYDVMFLTGTDEHGQKVEKAAQDKGVSPQAFTDSVSQNFRDLTGRMNFSNDDFIRTTEPRHRAACQALWRRLLDRGHISLGSYAGWYAVRDEAFYTETEIVDGKAPSGAPSLCMALAECLASQGLPVSADTDRALGQPEAIVAFGGDASMAAIQAATPQARHSLYGHRFSIAVVTGDPEAAAAAVASDAALYDGRGCMAPTAVFTTGEVHTLAQALAKAMAQAQARWPRGEVDAQLGPEWRRRTGLARVLGQCLEDSDWAVPVFPASHFHPVALPRMLPVHAISGLSELNEIMGPWAHQLSTCGTDDAQAAPAGTLRVSPLGQMQTPAFPRLHDGRSMLGAILG